MEEGHEQLDESGGGGDGCTDWCTKSPYFCPDSRVGGGSGLLDGNTGKGLGLGRWER